MHIQHNQTNLVLCVCAQDGLSAVSPVAYVDILEGDSEGHVRFKTPDRKSVV